MSNTFGRIFRMTTFGESHGKSIGVLIDGCPAGVPIDQKKIQEQLDRRKPGQSDITTSRKETDEVHIQSGCLEGISLGTPILLQLYNNDVRSKDYSNIKSTYRPSHADYTYEKKYGIRDYRGGGRSSARETAARVAAGAIAQQILAHYGVEVHSFVAQIHEISMPHTEVGKVDYQAIEKHITRCPDSNTAMQMETAIKQAKLEKDTLGGVIETHVLHAPIGLGEPIYDKLQARLAYAMMGINAVKGFEYGSGFEAAKMKGSEHNDIFKQEADRLITESNFSGGIQGGISNGMPIYFRTVFKPVATIGKVQRTVNQQGDEIELEVKGRHDPCVLPRAVPIVDAMTAITLVDFILLQKNNQLYG